MEVLRRCSLYADVKTFSFCIDAHNFLNPLDVKY